MRRRVRYALVALLTVLGLVGSTAVANPAQAYGSELQVVIESRDTTDCGCYLGDQFDGTFFQEDVGGVAMKMTLFVGSRMVAKVEFHPYGEHLWVYDNRNDGDTIYVVVTVDDHEYGYFDAVAAAGDNSAVNQSTDYNLSFAEGKFVEVDVWDDKYQTDHIAWSWGLA